MPVTVPRVSITQSADDLKHRDGLLRGFPEVESVIGKAGRADTPTDPAPLDMFETLVNFRPKAHWPKRVLKFNDAVDQTRAILALLEERGFVNTIKEPLLVLAPDLRTRSANLAFYAQFKMKLEEVEGRLVYTLGEGQFDIPQL